VSERLIVKTYSAGAAISGARLVKFGASDGVVVQAAAATDAIIGVHGTLDAASGADADVIHLGIAHVRLGGNVTRGALLTADANGKAVAAAPAAGANNRTIGFARQSGVADDIIEAFIVPSIHQGA